MGKSQARVEKTGDKPKRNYTRRSTKQAITGKDVENYINLGFAWTAAIRQLPWWNLTDQEKDQVATWSPQAATLLNKYLAEHAQKVKDGTDIGSVGVGMLMLVYSKLQQDAQYKREMLALHRQNLIDEEMAEDMPLDVNQRTNGKVETPIFGDRAGF